MLAFGLQWGLQYDIIFKTPPQMYTNDCRLAFKNLVLNFCIMYTFRFVRGERFRVKLAWF